MSGALSDGTLTPREAMRLHDREFHTAVVVLLYPHRHRWSCLDTDLLFDAPQWARWRCTDARQLCAPCPAPERVGWPR